jgi:hypothetical protein
MAEFSLESWRDFDRFIDRELAEYTDFVFRGQPPPIGSWNLLWIVFTRDWAAKRKEAGTPTWTISNLQRGDGEATIAFCYSAAIVQCALIGAQLGPRLLRW